MLTSSHPSIGAIILAAGRSTRMQALGTPKLLLPLGGRPLITYAVAAVSASRADPLIVVLGNAADRAQAALDEWAAASGATAPRWQTVVNPHFAQGMANSLCVGITALRSVAPDAIGTLILLADQPLVTTALIDTLLDEASATPEAITAASYGGQRGHPIYFPAALFGELQAVTGDTGGRSIIARHPNLLRLIAIADAEAALDVDHPEDYDRITALFANREQA